MKTEIINNHYFKLLSFKVICYAIVELTNVSLDAVKADNKLFTLIYDKVFSRESPGGSNG